VKKIVSRRADVELELAAIETEQSCELDFVGLDERIAVVGQQEVVLRLDGRRRADLIDVVADRDLVDVRLGS